MRKLLFSGAATLASVLVAGTSARAQHGAHEGRPEAGTHAAGHREANPRGGVLGIPSARDGSGTSWLPDETPMRALHGRAGGWDLMLHGNVFVGFDHQGSDAGSSRFISTNWVMGMARRPLAGGELTLRTMLSLEPLTVGGQGYPLLLQTGETYQGEPLVDRQHPHDLFMELAVRYARELGGGLALEIYGGPAGEPALGPTAFPHRASSMADALAPLGHHWQDSTHITFGLITVGIFNRWLKVEGSWFNGREPDEERYDLDLRGFDSFSARVAVNPTPTWSLQASVGFLESPETLEPEVSVHRVTASATHTVDLGRGRSWSTTAIWGRNLPSEGHASDSFLVESAADLGRWGTTFARAEYVHKEGHDFGLMPPRDEEALPVGALALGHVHDLPALAGLVPGVGIRGAVHVVPEGLEDRYGTRFPLGVMIYLRMTPAAMSAGQHAPTPPRAATQPPGGAAQPETIAAAEVAAFERARPVLEKHCASCHSSEGAEATRESLGHFRMDSYPLGGHHAREAGAIVRRVLGVTGAKPTMPRGNAGSVQGAELQAIVDWSHAFDRAYAAGLHGTRGDHPHAE
jgi:hypothetical protein